MYGVAKIPASPGTRLMIAGKMERFETCPEAMVGEMARAYLQPYTYYVKDKLWYPGSPSEQPAKYLRSMEIIASQFAEVQRIETEKQRQQAQQRQRANRHRQSYS